MDVTVQSLPDNMTPDIMTIALYDSFLVPKRIFIYLESPINMTFGLDDTFAIPQVCHIIRDREAL